MNDHTKKNNGRTSNGGAPSEFDRLIRLERRFVELLSGEMTIESAEAAALLVCAIQFMRDKTDDENVRTSASRFVELVMNNTPDSMEEWVRSCTDINHTNRDRAEPHTDDVIRPLTCVDDNKSDDIEGVHTLAKEIQRVMIDGCSRAGGPTKHDLNRIEVMLFTTRDIRDSTTDPLAYDGAKKLLEMMSGVMTDSGRTRLLKNPKPRPARMTHGTIYQN